MSTETIDYDFDELELFGLQLTASGRAEIDYTDNVGGFTIRKVSVDWAQPAPGHLYTAPFAMPEECRGCLQAELIRALGSSRDHNEAIEGAIRDDMDRRRDEYAAARADRSFATGVRW